MLSTNYIVMGFFIFFIISFLLFKFLRSNKNNSFKTQEVLHQSIDEKREELYKEANVRRDDYHRLINTVAPEEFRDKEFQVNLKEELVNQSFNNYLEEQVEELVEEDSVSGVSRFEVKRNKEETNNIGSAFETYDSEENKGFSLSNLFPTVITFIAIGFVISVGINVLKSSSSSLSAYNVSQGGFNTDSLRASDNMVSFLPILTTLIVGTIVIGFFLRTLNY